MLKQFMLQVVVFAVAFPLVANESEHCSDGKRTINEWINYDGTYADFMLPSYMDNSKACLVRRYQGRPVATEAFSAALQQTRLNHPPEGNNVYSRYLPEVIEQLSMRFDIYLIKSCKYDRFLNTCTENQQLVIGFESDHDEGIAHIAYAVGQFTQDEGFNQSMVTDFPALH